MSKKRVLGLDASTSTIGYSIVDYELGEINNIPELTLIYCNFYKPNKIDNIFVRLDQVRTFIIDLIKEYSPDEVALEDIILFMKGHSSANTVSGLAVLNRTVGLAALNATDRPPHLLNVMSIRHCLKLNKTLPAKEDMPELVAHHLGIRFPYLVNKKNKPIKENNDIADSMAVALAYIFKTAEKE